MLAGISVNSVEAQQSQWTAFDGFRTCLVSIQSTNNEISRFNHAMKYFSTEPATTIQLQDACYYLSSDEKKYHLSVAAFPNIVDKENFFRIYDSFSKFSWAIRLYHNTQEKRKLTVLENNYQLTVEKDNNTVYALLIEKGDLLLSNNEFDNALLIYQQALEFRPSDLAVVEKIKNLENVRRKFLSIVQAEKALNAQFDLLIQKGDVLLSANKVNEAIGVYEEAMALKPGDQTAYLRIKEASQWKMELSDFAEQENRNWIQYEFLIQKGDILLSSQSFDDAVTAYQQASALFPNEQITYTKIAEANRLKLEMGSLRKICTTSDAEFKAIKRSIRDQTFSDEQKSMAKKQIQKKCFTLEQLTEVVKLFTMDDDRLEMIMYLYDYSYQKDRFYELRGLLTFSSTKKEFDEFLVDKR